ncbi:ABC transporter substrate-binding protein [Subtercola boreus]|uniref:Nitrate ABC transporter substrate-binding protein n=1 Tax=Subtercola boreus TaxID=120213 RepID=A0A3E0WC92_9MICO|nr:ABC transporter substrate-binding protein [Subtercola boreus]RFA18724.1 nitrate ABC transporter substrate-binding protein [Subtercola boreus]RFA22348.1 nitrate ABC transporter substrate-binding protein [Subtercola boreus]RFA28324.1 nitrate ABC transporter substrate-binding protein [Subtercola boreus]
MRTTRSPLLRASAATAVLLTSAALLSACSTAGSTSNGAATVTDAPIGAVDLSGVCPANIVIQTDRNPEAEQGDLYQLIGPDPVLDSSKKAVSGPLYASGAYTGVNVEVRSGGPAIGFQTVTSQQYADPTITLGYANTDEAVQLSADQPVTAVFAPFEVGPQIIMWDPATYPDVKTIADLGKTDAVVRYFGGSTYMDYLTGSGILKTANVDGSYDGTPANFVTAGGKDGQQGFATVEPYVYQNEVPAWGKPVAFQLINDAGYPIYASALSVRTGDLEKISPCLTKLVPVLQQATVDYYTDPTATNDLIVKAVSEFNNGWVYTAGVASYSAKAQVDLGLVANGPDSTVGNFDLNRVQKIIDITTPLFTTQGKTIAFNLTPATIATNEFIDPSIGF